MSFIFPAALLTGFLVHLYVQYGSIPEVGPFVYGIKPAVIAIILSAIFKLGQKALKNIQLAILGLIVILASFLGVNEITAVLGAGITGMLWFSIERGLKDKGPHSLFTVFMLSTAPTIAKQVSTMKLFGVFLKVGAVLFGSGYVLVAYLDGELIQKLGWLTREQLWMPLPLGNSLPDQSYQPQLLEATKSKMCGEP